MKSPECWPTAPRGGRVTTAHGMSQSGSEAPREGTGDISRVGEAGLSWRDSRERLYQCAEPSPH